MLQFSSTINLTIRYYLTNLIWLAYIQNIQTFYYRKNKIIQMYLIFFNSMIIDIICIIHLKKNCLISKFVSIDTKETRYINLFIYIIIHNYAKVHDLAPEENKKMYIFFLLVHYVAEHSKNF